MFEGGQTLYHGQGGDEWTMGCIGEHRRLVRSREGDQSKQRGNVLSDPTHLLPLGVVYAFGVVGWGGVGLGVEDLSPALYYTRVCLYGSGCRSRSSLSYRGIYLLVGTANPPPELDSSGKCDARWTRGLRGASR